MGLGVRKHVPLLLRQRLLHSNSVSLLPLHAIDACIDVERTLVDATLITSAGPDDVQHTDRDWNDDPCQEDGAIDKKEARFSHMEVEQWGQPL